jgi:hypothetical protein
MLKFVSRIISNLCLVFSTTMKLQSIENHSIVCKQNYLNALLFLTKSTMPKIASHVTNFNNLWHHDSAIKDMNNCKIRVMR